MPSTGLQTFIHKSSEKGLSSVTTLILGTKAAALIDPPFLVPDAESVVRWIKEKTPKPLKAIFVTHHHPVSMIELHSRHRVPEPACLGPLLLREPNP